MKSEHVILNPELMHANKSQINDNVRKILREKNIKLSMHVLDSLEEAKETKETVVFIHGNSASHKIFNDQIEYYKISYRVIAIDLMGHGDSTKISDLAQLDLSEKDALASAFYNPLAMVKELEQVLTLKNVKSAYFVGWSLGGHLAYSIAADMPALVQGVFTVGSPAVRFSTKGFRQGFHDFFTKILIPTWITKPAKFSNEEAKMISSSMEYSDEYFIQDLMQTDCLVRTHLFKQLDNYDEDSYEVLDGDRFVKSSKIPVCLIAGEKDAGIDAAYYAKFSQELKNEQSEVIIFKGAGHALFKTHKQEYIKRLDLFLGKCKVSRAGMFGQSMSALVETSKVSEESNSCYKQIC